MVRAIDCLVIAWLFWVGSAIGSFLNVVAWRMPRGRSINGLSHCPRCNQRLAARDNWPVFGWIALKGRCRTCRLPISPRYPIVELLVGLCVTALGWVEVYGGGWNLPYQPLGAHGHGPLSMPIVTWETLAVWGAHTFAIAGLWGMALICFDGMRIPARLTLWVLGLLGLFLLAWWPLGCVPWQATVPDAWPQWSFLDAAVMRLLTGLAAATIIGRAMARYLCATADLKLDPLGRDTGRLVDLISLLAVVGIVVGWQASLGVVVIAILLARICKFLYEAWSRPWVRDEVVLPSGFAWFAIALPASLTFQLTFWRLLEMIPAYPSSQSGPWTILGYAALVLGLPRILASEGGGASDDTLASSQSSEGPIDEDEDEDDDFFEDAQEAEAEES